ncbi:MAG TPA: isoprenylcysteine carboxylmethyltransferase family protein [Candidatus Sulfotelmatobacter sp.]|jgi:protein-S-isoprenylcysteine O-methyltransferase Ste14|nr:isoprenylcysteine carboxylmethyltransferase family protein [Candidatus Sulfotelmatobacter sp.]
MANQVENVSPRIFRRAGRTLVGSGAYAALPFLGAGTLNWYRGWLFAVIFVVMQVAASVFLEVRQPELMEQRARGIRGDTKKFDKIFYLVMTPVSALYPIICGLDAVRFGWAPLPLWSAYIGVTLFIMGSIWSIWAVLTNTYAETTVRIQGERGQTVIQSGPYRVVRHPMYAGMIIGLPGAALILGSGWGLAPMLLLGILFVWRTDREDRTLQNELVGYREYAESTTRYRLVPGIW